MTNRKALTVCIDEHVPPEVKAAFQSFGFRAIRAAETRDYQGRDEADYLPLLYSRNEIFVTGDTAFVQRLVDGGPTKHAGVVFVPQQLDRSAREDYCRIAAGYITGFTDQSRFALRRHVIYPNVDGLHLIDARRRDRLALSWDWLRMEVDRPTTNRRR